MSLRDTRSDFFQQAVEYFWEARTTASERQRTGSAGADRGNRQAVTSGGHLDGFIESIGHSIREAVGGDGWETRKGRRVSVLPGYFRPEKEWDLIVINGNRLGAVIELKTQVGPSFGNNFNNRVEEALGSADDLWTAYREGAFGEQSAHWLGYLFLLEEHEQARRAVRLTEPIYEAQAIFRETSYARRYEIFLRRMVRERRYTAAALLMSENPQGGRVQFSEPADDLGSAPWMNSLLHHLAASVPR